jgi:SAM-dependent methyltransferase
VANEADPAVRVPGSVGGQHWLGRLIDHRETYGPTVIPKFLQYAAPFNSVLDIGAGPGRDLGFASKIQPNARRFAIEVAPPPELFQIADFLFRLNIERDLLPFEKESLDVLIANQVLEHTKEIFWIFHEMSRVLNIRGHIIIGVPNLLSLHNRGLMLFGHHPTQHKLYAAHVRVFSKRDFCKFLDVCWPRGYEVRAFSGSQFYPLPTRIARAFAWLFPSFAFSVFWLLRKTRPYCGEFLQHPVAANLETNFFLGEGS